MLKKNIFHNLCVIGTGYVGLPTGIGFAELGHNVICVDEDINKINKLNNKELTIYEENIEDLFLKHLNNNLFFTTNLIKAISKSDIIIIAVGTPTNEKNGEANLEYIYKVTKQLKNLLNMDYKVIAIKSTVPVKTSDYVENELRFKNVDIVSLPEFLREGKAMYDFFNPDRIVIGANKEKPRKIINELYTGFKTNILNVSRTSAELIKYTSNAFLAMKIQYINEIANLCEKCGANIQEVSKGIGLDTRIGSKFLNAGIGYGGSCFPKDTLALNMIGKKYKVDLSLVKSTITGNNKRIKDIVIKIKKHIDKKSNIAILGLAFKNNTDDCRQSPAIAIVKELIKSNKNIKVFDYKATNNAKYVLKDKVIYCKDAYEALSNADICLILTEWDEFKTLDYKKIKTIMNKPLIFDFRNILNKQDIIELGFEYKGIGQ